MEDTLITFETAKLAKEKGFPQDLFNISWYNRFGKQNGRTDVNQNGEHLYYGLGSYTSEPKVKISKEDFKKYTSVIFSAPTQSLLQKWLREEHKIEIWLGKGDVNGDKYHCEDITLNNILYIEDSEMFNTYEEALEKGLQEALKLI